ncbi:AcrR family transcriptional regulator [Streptomyces sp. SAI-208]|nr:AcrR family transcriptional regulator [Streptomyces sp. SAI-208]
MDTLLPIRWSCQEEVPAVTAAVVLSKEMAQLVRRAAGRPPVPPDRIVAMALQIVDEEGAKALSMRTLAERLDSGTATLYRHFGNRSELVAQVVDHMYGLVELDDRELASASRQQSLRDVAHAMFRALGRHGNAARLLAERIPVGPNAMALRGVDPAQFPAVHSIADALPVPVEEAFSSGLDLILRGLGAFHDGG